MIPQNLELPRDRDLNREDLLKLVFDLEQRALLAEKKLENLELVASFAQDVVDYWPKMSIRSINIMSSRVADLKEALSNAKRQD